jgi:simple sugar transport system permease protein
MIRYVNPFNVYNVLMDVIAAVVLGGAKLSGGSGTIFGTFLGVFTLYMIKNSLILMGIPSTWDSVIVGLIIIVSVAFTASRKKPA